MSLVVSPTPFDVAKKIAREIVVGAPFDSEQWSALPVELRENALFSSQIESMRVLQRAQSRLTDFLTGEREILPDGASALKVGGRARFVELMRETAIREGLGDLVPPEDRGGLKDITSQKRLELIFTTKVTQANSFAYAKQGMSPDVLDAFPAQRFIRVQDVKEPRSWHTQFENKVFLKTSPIWRAINQDFGVPWAPWGWGCGHDVEDVDREEAEALGLLKPGEAVQPAPMDFNENLGASIQDVDEDLLRKLLSVFGDRVKIEGDRINWVPSLP